MIITSVNAKKVSEPERGFIEAKRLVTNFRGR